VHETVDVSALSYTVKIPVYAQIFLASFHILTEPGFRITFVSINRRNNVARAAGPHCNAMYVTDRFLRFYFSPNERNLDEFFDPDLFFPIPQGTLPWQPIWGKIGKMTLIQHTGVSKWIRISQFQFTGVKWQYFCYILSYVGVDRSTNPRDYTKSFCNFWDKSAYLIKYLRKYWTKLHQLFSIDRHNFMYADYKIKISLQ